MDADEHVHYSMMFMRMAERMTKLEDRIIELEVHNQSLEERFRDYLETALVREDAANQRADKAEKRRQPHWTDMR